MGPLQLMESLDISNVVLIDDEISAAIDETSPLIRERIVEILSGDFDSENFDSVDELHKQGYSRSGFVDLIGNGGDVPAEIVSLVKEKFPHVFSPTLKKLVEVLRGLFGSDNVQYYDSVPEDHLSFERSIIFLDYELVGSTTSSMDFVKLINQQSASVPLPIVFVSRNVEFHIGTTTYQMREPHQRSLYFRDLRRTQGTEDYKNTLYDYMPKELLEGSTEEIATHINGVLLNLGGASSFSQLLTQLGSVIKTSSTEVLGRFYLLNARSIQELIREKVLFEGESESTFLLNWVARHMTKSIATNESLIADIHGAIQKITNWSEPSNELHDDVALQELKTFEMWDERVNHRYAPVEFGDIFEFEHGEATRKAILLTQTCTLAVRGNGERAGKIATLAFENSEKLGRPSGVTISDWDGNDLTFDLDETVSFPLEILDLTTTRQDGDAEISLTKVEQVADAEKYEHVTWSTGYRKLIDNLTAELRELLHLQRGDHHTQLHHIWIPYNCQKISKNHMNVRFGVKRRPRLDSQYALDVFQRAQAWWGRIGLPVNINFFNDYVEEEGSLSVDGRGFSKVSFFVKIRGNDQHDVAISIDTLKHYLHEVLSGYSSLDRLLSFFDGNELASRHYVSGQRLLSLRDESSKALDFLRKKGVHIKLLSKSPLQVEVMTTALERYMWRGIDITHAVEKVAVDSSRKYRLHVRVDELERAGVNIPDIGKTYDSPEGKRLATLFIKRDEAVISECVLSIGEVAAGEDR